MIPTALIKTTEWKGEVRNQKKILQALIEKLFHMKQEKKLRNCKEFSAFLFHKYKLYFSVEDFMKLFYLQNKDSFFHKKMVHHLNTTINDSYVTTILHCKNEFLITHMYNWDLFKNKFVFLKNYFHFVQNMLLLSSINLCADNFLEIIQKKNRYLKLKHLSDFYNKEKHNFFFTKVPKYYDIDLLIKLLKCFSSNYIPPFDFLNVIFYQCFCSPSYDTLLSSTSSNTLLGGRNPTSINYNTQIINTQITYLQKQKRPIQFLYFQEITHIMLYLGKLELYDIYEVFLKTHFIVTCSHLYHLIKKQISKKQTFSVRSKRCEEIKKEIEKENEEESVEECVEKSVEESVDSLLMSCVLYISSSYLHKNVQTKSFYVLLCAVLVVQVFRYLHVRYINEKKQNNGHNFVLLNRNDTYLSNIGFSKKLLLFIFIMKEVITEIKKYKSINPNILNPLENSTSPNRDVVKKENKRNKNNSEMDIDMEMEMIYRCIKELQTIDRIETTHIPSLLSIVNNSFLTTELEFPFNFISLELLKLLHHKLFVYPMHETNQKPFPKKRSMLEKDIFYITQYVLQTIKKKTCHILQNANYTLFTVDIVIHRNTANI